MAFLKKFDIKQICVVNHQDINILSNFGSRKTKNREMIGSSVKDFGSFYQKTLEAIFSKDRKTTALLERCGFSNIFSEELIISNLVLKFVLILENWY